MTISRVLRSLLIVILLPLGLMQVMHPIAAQTPSATSCPSAPETRLAIGMSGLVSITPPGQIRRAVRVHQTPATSAPVLFTITDGTPFTVIAGLQCANNFGTPNGKCG